MKNNKIVPTGLKGREVMNRIKDLMKLTPINESVASSSSVELTKVGPDNKTYAIVREGHEYFIKLTDKTENIVNEDFKYIGGLANKKDYAFPTYAKAIKYLNGKFISICEALDIKTDINVFRNDNIIENKATASGFANFPKGGGFSGEGNLEGNKELAIESEEEIPANPEDYKEQPGYVGVTEAEECEISDDSDLALENRIMSIASSIEKLDEAINSVLKKKV